MEHSIYAELCNILALLAQEQTISLEVYILSLVLAPPPPLYSVDDDCTPFPLPPLSVRPFPLTTKRCPKKSPDDPLSSIIIFYQVVPGSCVVVFFDWLKGPFPATVEALTRTL